MLDTLLGMPLSLNPVPDYTIGVTLSISGHIAQCIQRAMIQEVHTLEGNHPLVIEIMSTSCLSDILHSLGWNTFVTTKGRLEWIEPAQGKVLTIHDFWLFSHIARQVIYPTKLSFLLGEDTLMTLRFNGKGDITYDAAPLERHAVRKAS